MTTVLKFFPVPLVVTVPFGVTVRLLCIPPKPQSGDVRNLRPARIPSAETVQRPVVSAAVGLTAPVIMSVARVESLSAAPVLAALYASGIVSGSTVKIPRAAVLDAETATVFPLRIPSTSVVAEFRVTLEAAPIAPLLLSSAAILRKPTALPETAVVGVPVIESTSVLNPPLVQQQLTAPMIASANVAYAPSASRVAEAGKGGAPFGLLLSLTRPTRSAEPPASPFKKGMATGLLLSLTNARQSGGPVTGADMTLEDNPLTLAGGTFTLGSDGNEEQPLNGQSVGLLLSLTQPRKVVA